MSDVLSLTLHQKDNYFYLFLDDLAVEIHWIHPHQSLPRWDGLAIYLKAKRKQSSGYYKRTKNDKIIYIYINTIYAQTVETQNCWNYIEFTCFIKCVNCACLSPCSWIFSSMARVCEMCFLKERQFFFAINLAITKTTRQQDNKGRFCNNSEIDTLISERLSVENKAKLSQLEIVNNYCEEGVLCFQLRESRFVLYR